MKDLTERELMALALICATVFLMILVFTVHRFYMAELEVRKVEVSCQEEQPNE